MSRIDDMIARHCPDGVGYKALGTLGRRNSGTSITAGQMKTMATENGPIRVFAGGQTIADVDEDAIPTGDIIRKPSIIVKSRGHIGFTYYDRPFTHKSELWSYTINDPSADQRFIYYYLLTKVRELQELAKATSVKLPQLGVRDTDELRVPVPPLEIQREIVRILDSFTKLEAELEAELEARRNQYAYYRDALLMFDDSPNIEWLTLGEIGVFIRGKRFTKADYAESGVPCLHYGDIYTQYGTTAQSVATRLREELAPTLRYAEPGDLVIVDVGETVDDVGKAVAWLGEDKVAIHDHCFAFRHNLDPTYVAYCFQTARFVTAKAKYVARTKVKTLLMNGLANVEIPVPPLDEQRRIVAILNTFDALINGSCDFAQDDGAGVQADRIGAQKAAIGAGESGLGALGGGENAGDDTLRHSARKSQNPHQTGGTMSNTGISGSLPAELAARRKQYEYYRDKLLTFREAA